MYVERTNMSTGNDSADASPLMLQAEPFTVRCYLDATVAAQTSQRVLSGERLLAAQAMRLLMRLDSNLREARARFNQDWFRRLMRVRSKAASRLARRWQTVDPAPAIPLGDIRRRYHANIARYRYKPADARTHIEIRARD